MLWGIPLEPFAVCSALFMLLSSQLARILVLIARSAYRTTKIVDIASHEFSDGWVLDRVTVVTLLIQSESFHGPWSDSLS